MSLHFPLSISSHIPSFFSRIPSLLSTKSMAFLLIVFTCTHIQIHVFLSIASSERIMFLVCMFSTLTISCWITSLVCSSLGRWFLPLSASFIACSSSWRVDASWTFSCFMLIVVLVQLTLRQYSFFPNHLLMETKFVPYPVEKAVMIVGANGWEFDFIFLFLLYVWVFSRFCLSLLEEFACCFSRGAGRGTFYPAAVSRAPFLVVLFCWPLEKHGSYSLT